MNVLLRRLRQCSRTSCTTSEDNGIFAYGKKFATMGAARFKNGGGDVDVPEERQQEQVHEH